MANGDASTITSLTLGRGSGVPDPQRRRPVLVRLVECERPCTSSSRHLLDDVDAIDVGRGDRATRRDGRRLALSIPDPRMSSAHARLRRHGDRWQLEDLGSKNGCIVNGGLVRDARLEPGDLVELGHTFFLFHEVAVPADAAPDTDATELPAPRPSLATFVASLQRGFASLARIARTPVAVVLRGETGTGKEVVARALHELSGRPGPFVAVNCGALPEGLLEAELFGHRKGAFSGAIADRAGYVRSADRGTLFLDEVGELPAESQMAFLRVLQDQEVVPVGDDRPVKVDMRMCAATHRDLDGLVDAGQFRRDLYARMFGLVLELPPLRERRVDLGILIAALVARMPAGDAVRFTPSAMRALLRHDWPLNVRELEKCLNAAVALAGEDAVELDHLPPTVRRPPAARAAAAAAAMADGGAIRTGPAALREQLVELLTVHAGNVTAVARVMGKGRMQVHRWARRFGLDLDAFRR
ncbi:MAG: sigma 54-interacting transcriptional regulator [Kofleriaceae bacterium]|nr:sigma 54-interacting transcriptional regulator [Myxococcales bacterium]MCB9561389.1 sigma 54-interacting transcriptional regulator [Kofleriaceae bacterium]